MITGIDVSKWQGSVDWSLVAQSGHRFAFCKATEGVGYSDPRFQENWAGMKEAGLYRGAYHFARASKSPTIEIDAQQEADYFAEVMGGLGEGDLPPVLDIEWDKRAKGIKPQRIVRWCEVFLAHLETVTGRVPIIYTGPSFWRYRLAKATGFARYPLWEADYRKSSRRKGKPKAIPGWEARFWQYTGKGRSAGVVGNVDLNYFRGTEDELGALAHVRFDPPAVAPEPPPEPEVVKEATLDALLALFLERWFGVPSRSRGTDRVA
jgi:lysozyme